MHRTLEGAFRKKSFPFFLLAAGPILLIDCPQWWLRQRFSPNCLSQLGHLRAERPPLRLPSPRPGFVLSGEPGLGLPATCQEPNVVFFFPQEIIFPGTAAPGCQSLAFTKAHVCATVALLLGMLEFPLQILCLPAAAVFLRGIILIVRHKKGPV